MNTTNERPTPKTDALREVVIREYKDDELSACGMTNILAALADIETIERERDGAREELENHFASTVHICHDKCKRPMCVLRRERDEARAESLEQSRLLGMSSEREAKLLARLAAERALADRLAEVLQRIANEDYRGNRPHHCAVADYGVKAWKEARND